MTDLTIANEIHKQIGHKAFAMMGSNKFGGEENSLQFNVKGCRKINWIRVTLNAMDTYTVEFLKVTNPTVRNGFEYKEKVVANHDLVYCDQLHSIIESETGLYLKLF